MRTVDHIVYAVQNLQEGIERIHKLTGVCPTIGGRHMNKGTKNALLNLGQSCYLEIISADQDNTGFKGTRWMSVDQIQSPCITRWSLKSENLESEQMRLQNYNDTYGAISGGKRQTPTGATLQWQMIIPTDGPIVDVVPFFTDWSHSDVHPCDALPIGCNLQSITCRSDINEGISQLFDELTIENILEKGQSPQIEITINCPNGLVVLR